MIQKSLTLVSSKFVAFSQTFGPLDSLLYILVSCIVDKLFQPLNFSVKTVSDFPY